MEGRPELRAWLVGEDAPREFGESTYTLRRGLWEEEHPPEAPALE